MLTPCCSQPECLLVCSVQAKEPGACSEWGDGNWFLLYILELHFYLFGGEAHMSRCIMWRPEDNLQWEILLLSCGFEDVILAAGTFIL